jgi:hypothetical protein
MPTWRAGQQIGDVHILDLTTGAGRTPDYVAVGIYRREDGRRLVFTDADGTKRDYAIIPLR